MSLERKNQKAQAHKNLAMIISENTSINTDSLQPIGLSETCLPPRHQHNDGPGLQGPPQEVQKLQQLPLPSFSYPGLLLVCPIENVEQDSTESTFAVPPSNQNNQVNKTSITFPTKFSLIFK